MEKSKVIFIFLFLLMIPFVSASGTYEVKPASSFDKFLCGIHISECAESNIGTILLQSPSFVEQTVVATGTRLEGKEIIASQFPEKTVPAGTLMGFCSTVVFEDSQNKCSSGFQRVSYFTTVNGNREGLFLSKNYAVGSMERFCNTKTISSGQTLQFTKAEAESSCGTIVNQGYQSVSFTIKTPAQASCSAGWQCKDTKYLQYQRADCTTDSMRSCAYAGRSMGDGYCSNGQCVEVIPPVTTTPTPTEPPIVEDTPLEPPIVEGTPTEPPISTGNDGQTTTSDGTTISSAYAQYQNYAIAGSILVILIIASLVVYFKQNKKRKK